MAGNKDSPETAGPTAAAFGRTEKDEKSLYVTATGDLINPVGKSPSSARVIRIDIGLKGEV